MFLQDASGARLERFYSAKSEVPRTESSSLDDVEPIQPTSIEEPDETQTAAPDLVRPLCMLVVLSFLAVRDWVVPRSENT